MFKALLLIFVSVIVPAEEAKLPPPPAQAWGKVQSLRIHEPYCAQERTARGYPLQEVLDRLFGERWKKASELVFIARDGYRAVIPVERIQKHHALLAFEWLGEALFATVQKSPVKTIDLTPYYLVWENIQDSQMRAEKDHGWPYQTVAIELKTEEPLPVVLIPAPSSPEARGYAVFKSYCLSCHAVQGIGGKVGPELSQPVNVTEYYREEWLKRWIAQPTSIRRGTAMPPFDPPVSPEKKKEMIEDIVRYLKWLKGKSS